METKFKGSTYAPDMNTDDIFHCAVKFEGIFHETSSFH